MVRNGPSAKIANAIATIRQTAASASMPLRCARRGTTQQDDRDDAEPADGLDGILAERRIRRPLAAVISGCSGWPSSGASRSTPRGTLRHPYSWDTYSPRTISCSACHSSGAAPITNRPATPVATVAIRRASRGNGACVSAGRHSESAKTTAQIQTPVRAF